MRSKRRSTCSQKLWLLLLAACFSIPGSLHSQTSTPPAANDNWRLQPFPFNPRPEHLSLQQRKLRDSFWDQASPAGPEGSGLYVNPPVGALHDPYPGEFPIEPKIFWVVGTVVDYEVRLTGKDNIYTELHLRIDRRVGRTKPDEPPVHSTVDIDLAGGTVKMPDGSIREYLTSAYRDFMRPGHIYLVQLWKVEGQDFYRSGNGWDVSNGIAKPTFPYEAAMAAKGKSSIAGLPLKDAIKRVEAFLNGR